MIRGKTSVEDAEVGFKLCGPINSPQYTFGKHGFKKYSFGKYTLVRLFLLLTQIKCCRLIGLNV